jgi:hypothetical protein
MSDEADTIQPIGVESIPDANYCIRAAVWTVPIS